MKIKRKSNLCLKTENSSTYIKTKSGRYVEYVQGGTQLLMKKSSGTAEGVADG